MRGHPCPYGFAKGFDVMGAGLAGIDQEVAVFLRYLRPANDHAAASGGIDFLPCLAAGRVGKGAAARAYAARLGIAAAGNNFLHPGLDGADVAGGGAEGGVGKDPVIRCIAVAIGHAHLVRGGADSIAFAIQPVGADGDIAKFTAIGTGIHPQTAANRARYTDQEFQPGKPGAGSMTRHIGIGGTGVGRHLGAIMADRCHEFIQPDDHPGNAAIADQKV